MSMRLELFVRLKCDRNGFDDAAELCLPGIDGYGVQRVRIELARGSHRAEQFRLQAASPVTGSVQFRFGGFHKYTHSTMGHYIR